MQRRLHNHQYQRCCTSRSILRTSSRSIRNVTLATRNSTQLVQAAPEAESKQPNGRQARLSATKLGVQTVEELEKSLADYMSLPASQYSVLDARKIERVNDDMFRCYVGELKMMSWSVEPVLTVSVSVEEGGCTIRLLSCELKGSQFVDEINRKFQAQMANVVRWREGSEEGNKEIVSNTTLMVQLEVPAWCGFMSTSSIENVGSTVLQGVLNAMVPNFLKQLKKDYELWASGDTSRKPVGEL